MEHLSNDHKDHPNQHENSHKLCHETGVSRCEFDGKSMETETTTWLKFPNKRKASVEQIIGPEEINKSESTGLWESQSEIHVGKLTIWVSLFEIEQL